MFGLFSSVTFARLIEKLRTSLVLLMIFSETGRWTQSTGRTSGSSS